MPDIREYKTRQAWARAVLDLIRFGLARDESGFYRPVIRPSMKQVSPKPTRAAKGQRPGVRLERAQLELPFTPAAPAPLFPEAAE